MSALLLEVAEVLTRPGYASLRCVPTITTDADGGTELRVRVSPGDQPEQHAAFSALSLFTELQYVCDLAQMRALCEKYDIKPEALEALLPKQDE